MAFPKEILRKKNMADFHFKQFEIKQDRCAMKVGTDGVLIGAWAMGGKRILDIGSGTGLVALMMAQRFPHSKVVGIDIDEAACDEASENVALSPFADRVSIECCRLQDFRMQDENSSLPLFDAIVSNPPYFVNGMKNPDSKRALARHTDSLSFSELFRHANRLLAKDGVLSVIIPSEVLDSVETEAYFLDLHLMKKLAIRTVEKKVPKRYMLAFVKRRIKEMEEREEFMTKDDGMRSEWYAEITKDFYLDR